MAAGRDVGLGERARFHAGNKLVIEINVIGRNADVVRGIPFQAQRRIFRRDQDRSDFRRGMVRHDKRFDLAPCGVAGQIGRGHLVIQRPAGILRRQLERRAGEGLGRFQGLGRRSIPDPVHEIGRGREVVHGSGGNRDPVAVGVLKGRYGGIVERRGFVVLLAHQEIDGAGVVGLVGFGHGGTGVGHDAQAVLSGGKLSGCDHKLVRDGESAGELVDRDGPEETVAVVDPDHGRSGLVVAAVADREVDLHVLVGVHAVLRQRQLADPEIGGADRQLDLGAVVPAVVLRDGVVSVGDHTDRMAAGRERADVDRELQRPRLVSDVNGSDVHRAEHGVAVVNVGTGRTGAHIADVPDREGQRGLFVRGVHGLVQADCADHQVAQHVVFDVQVQEHLVVRLGILRHAVVRVQHQAEFLDAARHGAGFDLEHADLGRCFRRDGSHGDRLHQDVAAVDLQGGRGRRHIALVPDLEEQHGLAHDRNRRGGLVVFRDPDGIDVEVGTGSHFERLLFAGRFVARFVVGDDLVRVGAGLDALQDITRLAKLVHSAVQRQTVPRHADVVGGFFPCHGDRALREGRVRLAVQFRRREVVHGERFRGRPRGVPGGILHADLVIQRPAGFRGRQFEVQSVDRPGGRQVLGVFGIPHAVRQGVRGSPVVGGGDRGREEITGPALCEDGALDDRRGLVDVVDRAGRDLGDVSGCVDAAEGHDGVLRERQGLRIFFPVRAVHRILLHHGIIAEGRRDLHRLVRALGDAPDRDRRVRRDGVDVVELDLRRSGIPGFVRRLEVIHAVSGDRDLGLVGDPGLLVGRIIDRHAAVRDRRNRAGLKRRLGVAGQGDDRGDSVDAVDRVAGDLGHVAQGVGRAEIHRAVVRERDRLRIRLPALAVEAVFLHSGILAEDAGHDHVLIRRGGDVRGSRRRFRRELVDIVDRVARDLGVVSGAVDAAEEHRPVFGDRDREGPADDPRCVIRQPGLAAVETVFAQGGIEAVLDGQGHVRIRKLGDVSRDRRFLRRGLVDVHDHVVHLGAVAGSVGAAEIHHADGRDRDGLGVRLPGLAVVDAVFPDHGILAELDAEMHVLVRQIGDVGSHDRRFGGFPVDVVDRIARDLGHVARRVGRAEIHRAVVGERDRIGIRLPGLAVETVFLDCGILAEDAHYDNVLIRRAGDAGGGRRGDRRDLVDVVDGVARDLGDVPGAVDAAEEHRPVFGDRDREGPADDPRCVIRQPGLAAVETVFAQGGIEAVLDGQGHVRARGLGDVRRDFRLLGRGLVDVHDHVVHPDDVASLVDASEIHHADGRDRHRPGVRLPGLAVVDAVFPGHTFICELGREVHVLVRQGGDVRSDDDVVRHFPVDVVDRVARDFGHVARRVGRAEVHDAVLGERDRIGVSLPGLAVEAVFLHCGIGAEDAGDDHVLVRRGGDVRRGRRGGRSFPVDVVDRVGRDLGDVAHGVGRAEMHRAVLGERDRLRVCLPGLAVEAVFLHCGIGAEDAGHDHVAAGRTGDVRGGRRGDGRDRVDVVDRAGRNFGDVSGGVDAAEVHDGVLRERQRLRIVLPVRAVRRILLHHGIGAEGRRDLNRLVRVRRNARDRDRFFRGDGVDVVEPDLRRSGVPGVVRDLEVIHAVRGDRDLGHVKVP